VILPPLVFPAQAYLTSALNVTREKKFYNVGTFLPTNMSSRCAAPVDGFVGDISGGGTAGSGGGGVGSFLVANMTFSL